MTTTDPSTGPRLRWSWLAFVAATVATGALAVVLSRSPSDSATITDLACRNAALADTGGDRWVVQDLLPVAWQHRPRIEGTIEVVDGATVFSADGQSLPVLPDTGSRGPCFGWAVRGPGAAAALLDRPAGT